MNKAKNIGSRSSALLGKLAGREPYLDLKSFTCDLAGDLRRVFAKRPGPTAVVATESSFKLLITPSRDLLYWPAEYSHQIVDHVHNELTDPYWQDNYFRLWKPKKDDVVFDLGVCEGLFGYRIKDCVAQVHLFEPTPRIAAALRKTFETELTAGRAVVHECAIGEREGKVDFAVNIENLGRSGLATAGAANEACRVRMTTIDGVVEECEIDCLDVIEMDIEGAELQGLRGAVNTLRRLKPNLLICTYHREDDIPTIPRFLGENGYRITAYNCSYRQSR